MPRFVPDKWKPKDDSSEGYKTLDPESVVLHVSLRMEGPGSAMGCPCGCGDFPSGDKTTFCMGHDARLRGTLIRAHLMGVPIRYVLGDQVGETVSAKDVADGHFWTSYLEEAVLRRDGKNREVLRRAIDAGVRCLKYARWARSGQVTAIYQDKKPHMHFIEYVDQAGNIKTTRVRADESPLADINHAQQVTST